MRIELRRVSQGRNGRALPETSLSYGSARATRVVAETEQRPTVLGLLASGRMRPGTGTVLIDGAPDARMLRRRVALVDAPGVSEPEPNVSVAGMVAEELMFAGRPPTPFRARHWLDEQGFGDLAATPVGDIEPAARIRIVLECAALRPDVEGLVLVSPDRHGGDPHAWWRIVEDFAARDYAVLAIAGVPAHLVLGDAGAPGDDLASAPASSDDAGAPPLRHRRSPHRRRTGDVGAESDKTGGSS